MLMAPRRLVAAPAGVVRFSDPTMLGWVVSSSPHPTTPARSSGAVETHKPRVSCMGYIRCRLQSEAKVDSGNPVPHLGLGEEVGRGEVAIALPTLPEAVDLGIDAAVVVDGKKIAPTERQAGSTTPEQSSNVVGSVEGE